MQIESASAEYIPVIVHTSADPTTALPGFSVTTGSRSDPGTFSEGLWDADGWDSTTGRIVAWSPLAGAGQTLDLTDGLNYNLWVRWTLGSQVIVKEAGVVEAR